MFWHQKVTSENLKAYVSGRQVALSEVNDDMFSKGLMGDGLAIMPTSEVVYAPASGTIVSANATMSHAIGLKLTNGLEILIHIGLETVTLNNQGFKLLVKQGQTVKAGDPLISFNNQLILDNGLENPVILVITASDKVIYNIQKNHQVTALEDEIIRIS